ncbi:MAG: hypothetical protein PHN31_01890 [Candidatus Gracilibacteria bacterium]|nr:hypothetical protein [Candidatus Gracilibacteria bacterium]
MSFEKDFDKEIEKLAKNLIDGINDATVFLKGKIEDGTPEDTKTLVGNYETRTATQKGTVVSGSVFNDTKYAYWVEYGVGGRIFRYNKPKGNIFKVGVGARMMATAKEKNLPKIINIIKKRLGNK